MFFYNTAYPPGFPAVFDLLKSTTPLKTFFKYCANVKVLGEKAGVKKMKDKRPVSLDAKQDMVALNILFAPRGEADGHP